MACTTAQGAQIVVRFARRATVTAIFSCNGGGGGGDNSETNVLNGQSAPNYLVWPV